MTTSTTVHPTTGLTPEAAKQLCIESMHLMAVGDLADLARVVHPAAINREAKDEPPAAAQPGPAGFWVTALWLRRAFADLRFEIHDAVVEGDLVVVHDTMSGRQHGPMVQYRDGAITTVFPRTGRAFASTQTHWFRLRDGKVIEHWANRDDLATALQLGWIPPTPRFIVRMALAKRRERRLVRRAAHR